MVNSTCIFCGCGCRLKYIVENNSIKNIIPVDFACAKGMIIKEIVENKERIKSVLLRESKKKDFDKVSYDYAIEYTKDVLEKFNPKDMMFVGSGEITNEDNYVFKRLAEKIGCENLDTCARLCHAPTIKALKETFGIGVIPNKMEDIKNLDCLLLVGTDPFTSYPRAFSYIMEMKNKGGKLITISHYYNRTSKFSDVDLMIHAGTEILIVLSFVKELVKRGYKSDFENFDFVKRFLKDFNEKKALEISEVDINKFKEAIEVIESSKNFGAMNGMGITQTPYGTDTVRAILWLVLLKKGKILSLRGKINIQGCGEIGFERGKTMTEFFLEGGKFAWILQSNPAISLPCLNKVWENMKKMFIIYHNPFPSKTMEFANLVFPSLLLIEREGTIVAGDGRIIKVNRVIKSNLKQDWEIFNEIGRLEYRNPFEIFREMVDKYWPWNDAREIWEGKIGWVDKNPKFYRFPEVKKYPKKKFEGYYLITIRSPYKWVSGEISEKSETLRKFSKENYILISKEIAKKEKLRDGDLIEIYNEFGRIRGKVKIADLPKYAIVIEWHGTEVNKLVSDELEEETKIPSYKIINVKLRCLH